MDQSEIKEVIKEHTNYRSVGSFWNKKPALDIYLGDREFEWHGKTWADVEQSFYEYIRIREPIQYAEDDWDCEDETKALLAWMAKKFRGAPIGFAWSPVHAFCVVVIGGMLYVMDALFGFATDYRTSLSISSSFNLRRGRLAVI